MKEVFWNDGFPRDLYAGVTQHCFSLLNLEMNYDKRYLTLFEIQHCRTSRNVRGCWTHLNGAYKER
jgi:hypothetical protein